MCDLPILPLNTSDFIRRILIICTETFQTESDGCGSDVIRVNEDITPIYTALHITQIFICFLTHLNLCTETFQTENDGRGLMCIATIIETLKLCCSRHTSLYLCTFDESWLCNLFHTQFPPFSGSINHRCLFAQIGWK